MRWKNGWILHWGLKAPGGTLRQVCWAESGEDQDEAAAVGVVYGLGVNAARAARLPRTDAAVRGIDAAVARH
jgi:hypothetical protein